jgi:hypothetical protein
MGLWRTLYEEYYSYNPPFGVMDGFETRRVGSRYRLNELLPDTQTDTEIFSFNSFSFPLLKETHIHTFEPFLDILLSTIIRYDVRIIIKALGR